MNMSTDFYSKEKRIISFYLPSSAMYRVVFLTAPLGKYSKKNVYKAVRLTAWVDPPSPEAVRKK